MMSDSKSKLPDLKELGEMSTKLFKDIKNSVTEIINSYKEKRPKTTEESTSPTKTTDPNQTTTEKKDSDEGAGKS